MFNNLIIYLVCLYCVSKVSLNQTLRTSVNCYSKNTKTPRKKLPNEEKVSEKWVPNRKVCQIGQEFFAEKNSRSSMAHERVQATSDQH